MKLNFKKFFEAIEHPPHMPYKFFKEYLEVFKKIKSALHDLEIQEEEKGLHIWVMDFAGSNNWRELEDIIYDLNNVWRTWNREYSDIVKNIEEFLDFSEKTKSDPQWGNLVSRTLSDVLRQSENILETIESFSQQGFYNLLEEIEEEMDSQKEYFEEEEYPTYEEAKNQLNKLKEAVEQIIRMKEWLPKFKGQLSDIKNLSKDLPPHENVETMYHATANVPVILSQGFKTREQLGELPLP